jgi:hypothetical protein
MLNSKNDKGNLFGFENNVQPLLTVLVGNTLEESLKEIGQEDKIKTLRESKAMFFKKGNVEKGKEKEKGKDEKRKERYEIREKRKNAQKELISRVMSKTLMKNLQDNVVKDLIKKGQLQNNKDEDNNK